MNINQFLETIVKFGETQDDTEKNRCLCRIKEELGFPTDFGARFARTIDKDVECRKCGRVLKIRLHSGCAFGAGLDCVCPCGHVNAVGALLEYAISRADVGFLFELYRQATGQYRMPFYK